MTNHHSDLRILLIRLFLATCFIGGLNAAPIDIEIGSDPGADDDAESRPAEGAISDSRGSIIPFIPSLPGSGAKDSSSSSGLPGLPPFLPGLGSGSGSLIPGLPDISSAMDGMKLYLGAHQTMEIPASSMGNILQMFGNLPGLPSLPFPIPGLGNTPSTT